MYDTDTGYEDHPDDNPEHDARRAEAQAADEEARYQYESGRMHALLAGAANYREFAIAMARDLGTTMNDQKGVA